MLSIVYRVGIQKSVDRYFFDYQMVSENLRTQTGKIGNWNTISRFLFWHSESFRSFENFRNIPQRCHGQNSKAFQKNVFGAEAFFFDLSSHSVLEIFSQLKVAHTFITIY